MLRNPYFWKVDEAGSQLPYLNEVHYRLSTWADRDVQAVAGTGDNSAMEQPENYVEALKRAADPNAPSRLQFGARTIGYTLYPNLSGNGWGEPTAAARRCANSTATSISARASPRRSTGKRSATRW
jgi:peptide/nickel transport system substrate-binding protein